MMSLDADIDEKSYCDDEDCAEYKPCHLHNVDNDNIKQNIDNHYIIIKNIYVHITKNEYKFNPYYSCLNIKYRQYDASKSDYNKYHLSYPSRDIEQTIPFMVISKLPGEYINVMFLYHIQLNWGCGPTYPQSFYRINADHSINPYYCDYDRNKETTAIKKLINFTYDDITDTDCSASWSNSSECVICLEEKLLCITFSCKHCVMCKNCVQKL